MRSELSAPKIACAAFEFDWRTRQHANFTQHYRLPIMADVRFAGLCVAQSAISPLVMAAINRLQVGPSAAATRAYERLQDPAISLASAAAASRGSAGVGAGASVPFADAPAVTAGVELLELALGIPRHETLKSIHDNLRESLRGGYQCAGIRSHA